MKNGQLKVWHIPQVPGTPFEVLVDSVQEGALLLKVLADYDAFQYEHRIKPDYCNTNGLVVWDESLDADEDGSKWTDWEDPLTGATLDEWLEMEAEDQAGQP